MPLLRMVYWQGGLRVGAEYLQGARISINGDPKAWFQRRTKHIAKLRARSIHMAPSLFSPSPAPLCHTKVQYTVLCTACSTIECGMQCASRCAADRWHASMYDRAQACLLHADMKLKLSVVGADASSTICRRLHLRRAKQWVVSVVCTTRNGVPGFCTHRLSLSMRNIKTTSAAAPLFLI